MHNQLVIGKVPETVLRMFFFGQLMTILPAESRGIIISRGAVLIFIFPGRSSTSGFPRRASSGAKTQLSVIAVSVSGDQVYSAAYSIVVHYHIGESRTGCTGKNRQYCRLYRRRVQGRGKSRQLL